LLGKLFESTGACGTLSAGSFETTCGREETIPLWILLRSLYTTRLSQGDFFKVLVFA
jgi:hypothetical protein